MSLGFNHGTVELPSGASAGYKFELFLKELIGLDAAMANLNFDDLPIYDAFTLGGPNRLSGLRLDQLNGSRYDLCTLN